MYDAVVVIGSKPNVATWEFPSHVIASLNKAVAVYKSGGTRHVLVSGKWALDFEDDGIVQPFRECDRMADYLQNHGVPTQAIAREGQSKDTIANVYYQKQIFKARQWHKVLYIVADFRKPRLAFLCSKILGAPYDVTIATVPALPQEVYPHEADTLRRTQAFLSPMSAGDDSFLHGKFYNAAFYEYHNKHKPLP